MPLIFGAVHPVVTGAYTGLIIVLCGGWLLLNSERIAWKQLRSPWWFVVLFLLGWLFVSILPLPFALLKVLSPARALSLEAVTHLTAEKIKWAPLGYNPLSGLLQLAFFFSMVIYYLNLRVLLAADTKRLFTNKIIFTCIGLGLLEAMYGLLQVVNPHLGVLWLTNLHSLQGVARGTIIYKNQYASFLNLCWPFSIAMALIYFQQGAFFKSDKRYGRQRRLVERINNPSLKGILFLFSSAFIMMMILFSQSRGGVIAMVFILVLLLFFLPVNRKTKTVFTSGVVAFIIVYGAAVGFSTVYERFLSIGSSGQNRLELYSSSLPMLRDHFVCGIGIDSYQLLSPVYLKEFPENILYDRAHNEYLELLIELGVPVAVVFFSSLFFCIFMQGKLLTRLSRQKRSQDTMIILVSIISFCAISGFLFHGLADFGWRLPVNILYAVTLFALMGRSAGSHFFLTTPKKV